MEESNITPRSTNGRGPEISTEIVPVPSRHLPAHIWRSGAEMQYAREFRRRSGLDFEWMVGQLIDAAEPNPGDRALDVATGTGYIARQMALRVGPTGSVTGVDEEPEAIEGARLGAQSAGLTLRTEWRVAPANALLFPDDSFDIVTCAAAFHRLPTTEFLSEAYRVLKLGGRLILTDELKSPIGPLWLWIVALRGYDRILRREQPAPNEQFYLAEEIVGMLTETGFAGSIVRGLQPRNRRGRAFSLVKAVK
jgi:ubiquinone/menaquinone biosynthesis C-methylase UbiE